MAFMHFRTSVQVTLLSGAHSKSPLCCLLHVDGFRFLLDCEWTDTFDLSLLEPLKSVAPTVDAVLLSYPDTMHLGAYTYAFAKLGLQATMYCTLPVHHMGQMYMYDHVLSRKAVSNFDLFTLDDVDTAFSNSIQLKYQQHYQLAGKGEGMTITPYAAGHLLGGTRSGVTKVPSLGDGANHSWLSSRGSSLDVFEVTRDRSSGASFRGSSWLSDREYTSGIGWSPSKPTFVVSIDSADGFEC